MARGSRTTGVGGGPDGRSLRGLLVAKPWPCLHAHDAPDVVEDIRNCVPKCVAPGDVIFVLEAGHRINCKPAAKVLCRATYEGHTHYMSGGELAADSFEARSAHHCLSVSELRQRMRQWKTTPHVVGWQLRLMPLETDEDMYLYISSQVVAWAHQTL
eukprot:2215691-Alexandrium_andersonii.AAC.1